MSTKCSCNAARLSMGIFNWDFLAGHLKGCGEDFLSILSGAAAFPYRSASVSFEYLFLRVSEYLADLFCTLFYYN
jgi:hypothetical protein